MKDLILIIGKGSISFKHYKILKKIYKKKKILHISSRYFFSNQKHFLKKNYFLTVVSNDATSHIKTLKKIYKISNFIFIEKPLSDNFLEAKKYLSNKLKKKIWVGYNLNFSSLINKVSEIIKLQKYGRLISARSVVGYNVRYWRKKDYKKTVSINKKLGGGVLNELSHEINYLINLLGELKLMKSVTFKSFYKQFDVEDSVYATLINKNKILVNLVMDFYREDNFRECQLIFEKGTVFMNFIKNKIEFKNKTNSKIIFQNKNDLELTYLRQWIYLKKVLNFQISNYKNINNSLLTLKLTNQIKKL